MNDLTPHSRLFSVPLAGSDMSRLLDLARSMASAAEVREIIGTLDSLLAQAGRSNLSSSAILERIRPRGQSLAFNSLVLILGRAARALAQGKSAVDKAVVVRTLSHLRERLLAGLDSAPDGFQHTAPPSNRAAPTLEDGISTVYRVTAGRGASPADIHFWKSKLADGLPFHELLVLMNGSEEARSNVLVTTDSAEFVQLVYEHVLGRGATADELDFWRNRLDTGELTRSEVLRSLFETAVNITRARASAPLHDGLSCRILGSDRDISADEWSQQALELDSAEPVKPDTRYQNRFHILSRPQVLVSVLTSLYRGGEFIDQFMDMITSQTCFDDYCELIIVDADSPEDEYETIKRYLRHHKNINYMRMNYRIGIYDAWNVAAKAARGLYLTNANLDDVRRADSFELQAGTLDNLPFVDVVYQDLYYTFDPRLTMEQIAAFGHETNLPVITPDNLLHYNSPHNAPMWRKSLHEELGYFDIRYRSAGDYEFWLRCLEAGKVFYKINDPHVAYYQNPAGLSTRPDTPGVAEAMAIHRHYCRRLTPREAVIPNADFMQLLDPEKTGRLAGAGRSRYELAHLALRGLARQNKFKGRRNP